MSELLDAQVVTRRADTVHEDISSQLSRHSDDLWQEYAEKLQRQRILDAPGTHRVSPLVVTHPDEDHFDGLRAILDFQLPGAFPGGWPGQPEARGDTIARREGFRRFDDYLQRSESSREWEETLLAITTRATNETSTLVIWPCASDHEAFHRRDESVRSDAAEWTNDKNRRRCELVDKEISGTITDDERPELERLQEEMLVYRRTVAPLPIEDLRKLHQELLRNARGLAE